jgi:S1-C subfamily serine protease
MIIAIAMLVSLVVAQGRNVQQLHERIKQRELEIEGISDLLEASSGYLSQEDLARVRIEISSTVERLQALEARSGAPSRVVSTASKSVAFLQGAFGFVDPKSGEDLRFVPATQEGHLLIAPDGSPAVTIGGPGPPVEVVFSGSGFIATKDGLLLTNRHIALPWEYDASAAAQVLSFGLSPVMRRLVGYLPGISQPFSVNLVVASSSADLAVLRADKVAADTPPLNLSPIEQAPGDEVLVLGYPTGINALLARTDESLIDRLAERNSELDVWEVARELAEAGHINPLASRGIVAQVTPIAVVFDAETTHGGSGGPVLDFDGRVVAVTSAIVPEFGGSNLGVPAAKARLLLLQASSKSMLPPRIR